MPSSGNDLIDRDVTAPLFDVYIGTIYLSQHRLLFLIPFERYFQIEFFFLSGKTFRNVRVSPSPIFSFFEGVISSGE